MGILMLAAKKAVLSGPATGEQKQGHFNAKRLLKEGHHTAGLGQSTATDRLLQGLPGLSTEHGKQAVQTMHLQGLGRGHAPHLIKAVFEAILTDVQSFGQFG
jgi:hypothetical protein